MLPSELFSCWHISKFLNKLVVVPCLMLIKTNDVFPVFCSMIENNNNLNVIFMKKLNVQTVGKKFYSTLLSTISPVLKRTIIDWLKEEKYFFCLCYLFPGTIYHDGSFIGIHDECPVSWVIYTAWWMTCQLWTRSRVIATSYLIVPPLYCMASSGFPMIMISFYFENNIWIFYYFWKFWR